MDTPKLNPYYQILYDREEDKNENDREYIIVLHDGDKVTVVDKLCFHKKLFHDPCRGKFVRDEKWVGGSLLGGEETSMENGVYNSLRYCEIEDKIYRIKFV